MDIEPLFTKVLEDMSKAKEAADAALGINNKKRRETKHKSVEPSNDIATGVDQTVNDTETVVTGESEDPALLEAKLVAIRKKAEREKAWFMAHTHQYIQFPEETAFCIVCKQREVEYYCKLHKDAEKNMAKDFPKILDQYTEEMEADIRGDIEYQFSQQYQSQAVALVEEELQKEAEAAATEQSALPQIINKLGSLFGDRSDVQADESIQEQRMRLESQDAAEEDLAWESHLNNAKRILDKAGLCHVDNKGKSILPERPQTTAKKRFIPPHVVEALTNGEDASIGLKIRVWHRDLNGLRSYFLGAIAFTEQECLDPPNGIRSYKLQDDSAIVGSDPITVTGVITLKFNVTKVSKRPKKRRWRLEIIRASKLAAVDESDLSNPYCEVYWKGLVEINGRMEGKGDWISVGCTVRKNKTLGPKYDKDDGAVFDLPPIYTEKELFNRGINETDVVKTGGFIARNFCNDNEDEKAATKKKDNKFEFGSKSVEENKKYRIGVKLNELYTLETVERLTILREQRKAEERERKSMGVEELLHRQYLIQVETMRCKPLMEIQQAYAKSFMRLLQLVQEAPNMLARLRFMMAMPLEGGGMKVLCQDPTNLMMYDTVIVPLLYKEDERNLVEQLNCLIGKFAPNLTKITDFSVHQVRDFNFKGFVTTSERVGITILEHYEGPTVLEYIEERWEKFNNEQMREVLNQIISAIVSLHEEGIIHRNIHPKSIVVQLPDLKKNRFGAVSEVSVSPVKKQKVIAAKPVCRLGEYLLLHNPRKPNCNYSQGRADWGDKSTRPPDQTITAKSDVYGFGICVYHWATKGSMPPNTFYHTKSVDVLMKDIPTKWGKWMSLLLNMCLQANPSMRASSKEIQLFLSAKVGK